MSIKATMQIELSNVFGKRDGLILYKVTMAHIIQLICVKCLHSNLASEVKFQVMNKLSRRIQKQSLLKTDNAKCQQLVDKVTTMSIEIAYELRNSLNEEFGSIVESFKFSTKLNMSEISESDVKHKNPKVYNELSRLATISSSAKMAQPKPLTPITRNFSDIYEALKNYDDPQFDSVIPLNDLENWTVFSLNDEIENDPGKDFCHVLYYILDKYSTAALKFYANDPKGYSRLILASIKIVCALDAIATKEFPLLLEHNIGFDWEPIECLLLPLQTQMKCAHEVKEYIDKRNANGLGPSLVKNLSDSSYFGAKYAKSNTEMIRLKQEILLEIQQKIKEKENEVLLARNEYERLIAKSKSMKCTYSTDNWGREYHASWCEKCTLIKEAQAMRIKIFEKYLPDDDTGKNLVIFELRIPKSINSLRDAICILKSKILKVPNQKPKKLKGIWIDYAKISSKALNIQEKVSLGSTSVLFENSHYQSLHPNSSLESFVVPNGYNIMLCLKESNETLGYDDSKPGYKKFCVLKASSLFDCLQFALESCSHNENQILAMQKKCPCDLNLNQFVNFGFFRAGNRMQFKNLLSTLITRSVPLSHQAVLSLFTQSLYELESLAKPVHFCNQNLYPVAHEDFKDPFFCEKLTDALNDLLELSSKKWNDHNVLLTIIEIVSRSISMAPNEEILQNMVEIMRKCRLVAIKWQNEVENVAKKVDYQNKSEIEKLRIKILEICCSGVLTFNTESIKVHLLMNSDQDILSWLRLISKISNFNSLYGKEYSKSSHFLINMQRKVQMTISLVESKYSQVVNASSAKALTKYVESIWPVHRDGKIAEWKQKEAPLQEWYEAKFILNSLKQQNTLQIGINGEFLVDSQPMGRLPKEILKHKLYEGYFLNLDFIVYPSTTYGSYITSNDDQVKAANYEFNLYENDLVIIEKDASKNRSLQLIPRATFLQFFPKLLVENFSHWLNKEEEILVFRPNLYSQMAQNEFEYVFNVKSKILLESKSQHHFIYLKSKTFHELERKITNRLESPEYVHVVLKSKGPITIELPRMSLSFEIEQKTGRVMSGDFRGFMISEVQDLGSLIGLQKGLVLTEAKELKSCLLKKKFLVPHGKITVSTGLEKHQKIDTSLVHLNKPAFFSYDVDSRLKVLRAGESFDSRLYLACLHAYTSSFLPDPFLEQTGTEQALNILQSGFCWSMQSYSKEALNILKCISELSPGREFYPKHLKMMQIVKWNENLPSLIAHNGFKLLVKKLIKESLRLETSKEFEIEEEEDFLWMRAYNRNFNFYNLSANLNQDFESSVIEKPSILKILPTFKAEKLKSQNSRPLLFNIELSQRVRDIKESSAKENIDLISYIMKCPFDLKGSSSD